jgi:hypothetical protein
MTARTGSARYPRHKDFVTEKVEQPTLETLPPRSVATVATVRGHGEKVFIAVHRDTPRGVRVRLAGAPWDEWIVGCADPEAVAGTLASAS